MDWCLYGDDKRKEMDRDLKPEYLLDDLRRYQDVFGEEFGVKELLMMMAETCREFEKLPIIKYGDILRNILYSGVWCRFEEVSRKRREEREKEHVGSI